MRFLLLALFVPAALAQQTLPLSLRRAVEIAFAPEGNTRIELAREAIAQAEARRSIARSALLPQLDAAVSYQDVTRNLQAFGIRFPSIPGLAFSSFVGPFGIFDARTTASQAVLDLSSLRRFQSAKTGVDVAKFERDWSRTQVADQVARLYIAALRAEAHLETAKANVQLAERLRALAESQKRAGTGTGIEGTRAEVQLANERQRLLVAENDRARARLQLLRALDVRLDTDLELTDRLRYEPLEPLSLEQALQTATAQRSDWKAQQQRERAAQQAQSAARMERMPSVAAFADYGPIGTGVTEARATRAVGVSLRVPIFSGGRREARAAEAASQLRVEQIRARDLRAQLELELRLAFDSLRSAELQVATSEQGVTLATRELEQAERRYTAGLTSSVETADAQARLTRARENRIAALFQHNLARLDLGTALGAVERYLP